MADNKNNKLTHFDSDGKAVMVDQIIRLGHKVDRVLPVKQVARKIINR